MKWAILLVFSMAVCARADDLDRAELHLLRKEVDRLKQEVADLKFELKNKIDRAQAKKASGQQFAPAPAPEPAIPPYDALKSAVKPVQPQVVFVIDGSGSMLNVFQDAIADVEKAIGNLPPTKTFNVIVDQEAVRSWFASGALATEENKDSTCVWLDRFTARGEGDGLVGLKAAIQLRPEVIWFLNDGEAMKGSESFLAEVKRANAYGIKINTTTKYSNANPAHVDFQRRLAMQSGGKCIDENGKAVAADVTNKPTEEVPDAPPPPRHIKGPSIFDEWETPANPPTQKRLQFVPPQRPLFETPNPKTTPGE